MTKNEIIDSIVAVEGGYVNNPNDSGGATIFGITEKVARDYGYSGDMSEMPRDLALQIYEMEYWATIKGDELLSYSAMIAHEVMDTSVNMGASRAVKFLQWSLNVLSPGMELEVDGLMGSKSLQSLENYMSFRYDDEITLCKALNCLQGSYYIELAERREKDKEFVYGWLKNRVSL